MASTYSTNLAIELIATGDQANAWGNTNNTNLGTLIEQAISGYVTQTITDGLDTVVTIPNGASGVARNMYIEMTGALTAVRNLIVPANKKLYFIYNNTTGTPSGYNVTVKVSGQTGVVVPNGKKMLLVCDGTDVVEAINYFSAGGTVTGVTASSPLASSGGAAPNITLTGTVSVGNGGTGLASYTTGDIIYASGSANLSALAAVATGNSLISGGVGTAPSWGKIGLTTHVDGTLAVGNGGTGAANLSANAVLLGNNTSALQTVAPGASGNLLTSDGTTWISSAPPPTAAASMYAYENFGGF